MLRGHGFEPVIPPVLVTRAGAVRHRLPARHRAADLPPGRRPLYLTGTSEVPLASLHAGEIMDACRCRYAGFSPCFRREAGAAGKDTRGIFRVHQFDKVEMFSFVEPERSLAEHERLLAIEEEILQGLEIPYRVVNIAVDDLGSRRRQEVRPRGLAAVPAALPRAHLDLEHDRLPVPPARHPLPAGRRQARARPHAERHGGGRRPHADRADGEPPDRTTARSACPRRRSLRRAGNSAASLIIDGAKPARGRVLERRQAPPEAGRRGDPGAHPHAERVPRP